MATTPRDSTRQTLAQFLLFTGPIVFAGGFVAIWRTGQRSVFYALLGLLGLLMWTAGFYLRVRGKP